MNWKGWKVWVEFKILRCQRKRMYKILGSHFSYFDIKYVTFKGPDWVKGTKVLVPTFDCEMYWKTIKPRSHEIADLAIFFFFLLHWLCLFIYSNNSKTFTKSQDISNCFTETDGFALKRRTDDLLLFNHWRVLILFFPTKLVTKYVKNI